MNGLAMVKILIKLKSESVLYVFCSVGKIFNVSHTLCSSMIYSTIYYIETVSYGFVQLECLKAVFKWSALTFKHAWF